MHLKVSTGGGVDPATRYTASFATILICVLAGLTFLSMFSGVHTTVRYGWEWITAWSVTVAEVLVSLVILWHRMRDAITFRIGGGTPEKVLCVFAGAFGFSMLAAGAIFSGVPIVLHHLTSSPGQMTVTVTDKEDDYQRRACRPRLYIEEFTFFGKDHICPGDQAFASIDVGSRITLKGDVSPFGISAKQVVRTTTQKSASVN